MVGAHRDCGLHQVAHYPLDGRVAAREVRQGAARPGLGSELARDGHALRVIRGPCMPARRVRTVRAMSASGASSPRFRRPASLSPEVAELLPGEPDPSTSTDLAHDSARALLNGVLDRKSTRLNSSHVAISYAVFCLKTK